jgi:hypothetical protein
MKLPWFKRKGILFIPVSFPGWIITLVSLAFAVYSFIEIDNRSHSVSDTLMNFVFRLVLIAICYSIISWITSREKLE